MLPFIAIYLSYTISFHFDLVWADQPVCADQPTADRVKQIKVVKKSCGRT